MHKIFRIAIDALPCIGFKHAGDHGNDILLCTHSLLYIFSTYIHYMYTTSAKRKSIYTYIHTILRIAIDALPCIAFKHAREHDSDIMLYTNDLLYIF